MYETQMENELRRILHPTEKQPINHKSGTILRIFKMSPNKSEKGAQKGCFLRYTQKQKSL